MSPKFCALPSPRWPGSRATSVRRNDVVVLLGLDGRVGLFHLQRPRPASSCAASTSASDGTRRGDGGECAVPRSPQTPPRHQRLLPGQGRPGDTARAGDAATAEPSIDRWVSGYEVCPLARRAARFSAKNFSFSFLARRPPLASALHAAWRRASQRALERPLGFRAAAPSPPIRPRAPSHPQHCGWRELHRSSLSAAGRRNARKE